MKVVIDIRSVELDDPNNTLIILDQTVLPNETKFLKLTKIEEIWDAIYTLKVRGAPAIGIAAAYGAYLGTKISKTKTNKELIKKFKEVKDYLEKARPTAVNLSWALNRMEAKLNTIQEKSVPEILTQLKEEAELIRQEDEEICKNIGKHLLTLLKPNSGILTHCNAGTIATAKYGTALSPIYLGAAAGYNFKVYAGETRPLLQGARLTAWELLTAGIDTTLICDNMASTVMKEGKINAVIVGCDRVARNGDTANKIGTSGLAILAKYYNIPFYVCAPSSSIDLDCKTGEDIQIELRDAYEVTTMWYNKPMAPKGVVVYNPSFDVTDNSLITAIITEKGVIYPNYNDGLLKVFK